MHQYPITNLEAMASNLRAMASTLLAKLFNHQFQHQLVVQVDVLEEFHTHGRGRRGSMA